MALQNHTIPHGEIIIIHHINPITIEDVVNRDPKVFDENNVVCVRHSTHEAIHYGNLTTMGRLTGLPEERFQNDMIPWKI